MDLEKIEETDIWRLYQKGRDYCSSLNMFNNVDLCYRMYNDDQWHGVKLKGIEPIQLNFLKPIVRYKVGIIHNNLYGIVYSSQNIDNLDLRKNTNKVCKLLNKKVAKIWENSKMDMKSRSITKDAAICSEGIIHSFYNAEIDDIDNEILNKTDIFYGDENSDDIQSQPYILIKRRMSILNAREYALKNGVSEEESKKIIGDLDNLEEAGDSAKKELDNMCTIITKLYRKNEKIYYSEATRWLTIKENEETNSKLYPLAHLPWEEKKGSARGEGEILHLIPNQIEVNKTLMRRAIVGKKTAFPTKVVNTSLIQNMDSVDDIGGTIKVNGQSVEDVRKVVDYINPAQMSNDIENLQNDLIKVSRELAGAGDIATGDINPESASGKAILAVQQASQQPLTEQLLAYKNFVEDLAKIWLDLLIANNPSGIKLEDSQVDQKTGEEIIKLESVPYTLLRELKTNVKIDITPKSPFDKYAQEASLENLLKNGYLSIQKLQELKVYANSLDDDSVMPKQKILEMIKQMEEEQRKIMQMENEAQIMQQKVDQYLRLDPEAQGSMLYEAEALQNSNN